MVSSHCFETVVPSSMCVGCGLCQSIISGQKIKIVQTSMGYFRPVVTQPLSKQEYLLVRSICPGAKLDIGEPDPNSRKHPVWGSYFSTREGHATDPDIRFRGSSGGVISALLVYLIETKKVDYVLQTGVSTDDPLANITRKSSSRKEILTCAGSRYAPSAPLSSIVDALSEPGMFAFVGKPCDVAGLLNYALLNPQVKVKIPYMLSFMCAGTPSLHGTLAILKEFGVKQDELVSFRYRGQGWPGMTTAETAKGKCYQKDYASAWGTLGRYVQFRCRICPDGTGEMADVVCADAWNIQNSRPDFAEKDGLSLVISRTQKGEQLVQECLDAGFIQAKQIGIKKLSYMQPYQKARKESLFSMLFVARLLGLQTPQYRNFDLIRPALRGGLLVNAKYAVGLFMRLFFKTVYETPRLPKMYQVIAGLLPAGLQGAIKRKIKAI